MIVCTFTDEDFGEVKMDLCKETGTLKMNDLLVITNTPSDFDKDMIFRAWAVFKANYASYGFVSVDYNQISQMEIEYE